MTMSMQGGIKTCKGTIGSQGKCTTCMGERSARAGTEGQK